jgi:heterodisulfide reductase subunit C
MPIGGRKVPPVAVEKQQARVASTISGREVDLPAMWNRMFEPRVLTDYGPDGFAAIAKLPGGESLEWCYGCGKCTPVCPVDMVGDYGPRKIHRKVQTGTDLFAAPDLWLCTACGNCLRVCPKRVDMIAIMPAVREAALSGAAVPAELQEVFEKTFRYGNALGQNQRRRARWAETAGVPVRVLATDPLLRRGLLEFPPPRPGRGPRVRQGGHGARNRLGDPRPGGEDAR